MHTLHDTRSRATIAVVELADNENNYNVLHGAVPPKKRPTTSLHDHGTAVRAASIDTGQKKHTQHMRYNSVDVAAGGGRGNSSDNASQFTLVKSPCRLHETSLGSTN